ncbi:MAG: immunity 26/phosphotriesterase HocA family protein, partial [Oscillospiraceae bacterium]|nr:immunity 26/phosphotriesterase HocA family protein [Oscillospiraceae bacterium]
GRVISMTDKKALRIIKKYLYYKTEGELSEADKEYAVKSGVMVPDSAMTHDEIISEIKELSARISVETAAKAFLYSLSVGDMRYRSALSSILLARALPRHELVSNGVVKDKWRTPSCTVCGCEHGFDGAEIIDWNWYGVFRYFPPAQYGREPDYTCAEYVLSDLREFEKLPAVEPCDEDYRILNGIFACVYEMKPHNMDTALVSEIRKRKFFDATGNAIHCILGILSVCGILEGARNKGYLNSYTNYNDHGMGRGQGMSFYPLNFWRGRDGVNYDAVNEIFGSFSGDKLSPDKALLPEMKETSSPEKKDVSKAQEYFTDGVYTIKLTDDERRFLALDPVDSSWEMVSMYSVTHNLKKRTVLFYDRDTIVKVIYEAHCINDDGTYISRSYEEYDTRLETENRTMLLPLTARGRAKPVTPTNVMAVNPFGCTVYIHLQPGKSRLSVYNLRNDQDIAIGEEDRIKKIMSDEEFHEFMRYYISTCPDDYFERITAVRNMEHQTVRFSAGDIFRVQVDREHYAYGLILGKTRRIEKWDELPGEHSFRSLMTQPVILRMYDFVTTDRDMTAEELSGMPLRSPKICSDNDIIWGRHKIVAHKELVPDDIQFRLQLARQIKKNEHLTMFTAETFVKMTPGEPKPKFHTPRALYIEWGFASFEIPWEDVPENIRNLLDEGVYFNGGVSLGINADLCGKTVADVLEENPGHLMQYDLLLPENRDKFNMVMDFLGLPADCTIDDFAKKYGGISRERYIELINTRK